MAKRELGSCWIPIGHAGRIWEQFQQKIKDDIKWRQSSLAGYRRRQEHGVFSPFIHGKQILGGVLTADECLHSRHKEGRPG